jgi:hypothetical protein
MSARSTRIRQVLKGRSVRHQNTNGINLYITFGAGFSIRKGRALMLAGDLRLI